MDGFLDASVTEDSVTSHKESLASLCSRVSPEVEFGPGTFGRGLLVNPAAAFYAACEQRVSEALSKMSVSSLAEATSDEDTERLEALVSNMGVARLAGSRSSGTLLCSVEGSSDFVFPAHTTFKAGDSVLELSMSYRASLDPASQTAIDNVGELQMYKTGDSAYSFALPVAAAETGNIVIERETSAAPVDGSFTRLLSCAVGSPVQGGSGSETNSELAARYARALGFRGVTGSLAVRNTLTDAGHTVLSLRCVGFGDSLMTRNRVPFLPLGLAGEMDVWVRSAALPLSEMVSLPVSAVSERVGTVTVAASVFPGFYRVSRALSPDGVVLATEASGLSVEFIESGSFKGSLLNGGFRFSAYQKAVVTITSDQSLPSSVVLEIEGMPGILEMQETLEESSVAFLGGSALVRAAVPLELSVDMAVKTPVDLEDPSDAIREKVAAFINQTEVGKSIITAGELAGAVTAAAPEATLLFPVSFVMRSLSPSGEPASLMTVNTVEAPRTGGAGAANSCFICAPSDINITVTN